MKIKGRVNSGKGKQELLQGMEVFLFGNYGETRKNPLRRNRKIKTFAKILLFMCKRYRIDERETMVFEQTV